MLQKILYCSCVNFHSLFIESMLIQSKSLQGIVCFKKIIYQILNCTKAKTRLIHPLLLSTKPGMSWHSTQNVCWMNKPHLHSSYCEPWTSNTSIAWESGRKAGSPHLRLLEPESEQALQVIYEHVTILESLYLTKHTSFQPLDMSIHYLSNCTTLSAS